MSAFYRTRRQAGFSLVELMVALVLGLILTSGVISVYITSKNTYNVNNALGAVMQHGRFAFTFMDPKIRLAGFTGCKYVTGVSNNLTGGLASDPIYSFSTGVYGYEANGTGIGDSLTLTEAISTTAPADSTLWTPDLTTGGNTLFNEIQNKAVKDSDIFMVREMQGNPPALKAPTYDDNTSLYVSTTDDNGDGVSDASGWTANEIAMVSNCGGNVNVFKVASASTTAGTITYNALSSHYGITGGNVGPAVTYVYYVGKGVDGGPALFQGSLSSSGVFSSQELVSGIENMQVVYGIDTDGDKVPNNFETADEVDSGGYWNRVVSVRVALIARSDDNSTDQAPTSAPVFHMLASDAVNDANGDGFNLTTPVDRRLRKYFVRTFSVRNALP